MNKIAQEIIELIEGHEPIYEKGEDENIVGQIDGQEALNICWEELSGHVIDLIKEKYGK